MSRMPAAAPAKAPAPAAAAAKPADAAAEHGKHGRRNSITRDDIDQKAAAAEANKAQRRMSIVNPNFKANPPHLDGVPDMSSLIYLEEDNVVHNLTCRYAKKEIYTYVSSIVIAVNPYEKLAIYGPEQMAKYRGLKRMDLMRLPPHCYAVAEESYQLLAKTGVNQSMVICGESGSGKTESAKVFMRYLAQATAENKEDASAGKSRIEEQFLQANPILEAFGNAQTILNNNSSRFGKFTKVLFENVTATGLTAKQAAAYRPRITGSFIETYLLEKTRVVQQSKGERNYHVFYQLVRGLPEEIAKEWKLLDVKNFHYLDQSGTYDINGVSDQDKFQELERALTALNFTSEQQLDVYQIVAGILHLGNIDFNMADADAVAIDPHSKEDLEMAARLFQVTEEGLKKRLTTASIKVGFQVIVKPLKADEAVYNRNAIAKSLYSSLFNWLVRRMNLQLSTTDADKMGWIGILDVFGFEFSDWDNSFEQFCINFANERLQQYFNEHVIASEQAEYLREGIPWTPLKIPDNQDTINLVDSKPNGILALLDSTCVMPKGTDAIFIQNLFQANKNHARIVEARTRPLPKATQTKSGVAPQTKPGQREKFSGFTVDHYAGKVTYNVEGFLDKNTDSAQPDTVALFASSECEITKGLLTPAGSDDPKAPKRAFQSVGAHFSKQLDSLMTMLRTTTPHFVRCVNPNQFKRPQTFDPEYVRPQLRCGGLIEALRVLKLGFPSRCPYSEIYGRYGHLLSHIYGENLNQKDFTEAVFVAFGLESKEYQLGITKVFFRPGKQEWLETVLGQNPTLTEEMINKIRSLMIRKRWRRAKCGVFLLTRFQLWINKMRSFRRVSDLVASIVFISKAIKQPLIQVFRNRAAVCIQSFVRVSRAQRAVALASGGVKVIQKGWRRTMRRRQLTASLKARIEAKRALRNRMATQLQKFYQRATRRHVLRKELARRVEATRERVRQEKLLEEKKRQEAERERLRKLEEERLRIQKEQEERARKLEEERRRKEAELEAKRKAEEEAEAERKRIAAEKAQKEREAMDQKRREEAERMAKLEAERREKEEAEKQRKAAEVAEKARVEAEKKAKAEAWKLQVAAEKKKAEEERLAAKQKEEEERSKQQAEQEAKQRAAREAADKEKREAELLQAASRGEVKAEQAPKPKVNVPPPPPGPPPKHILEELAQRMRQVVLGGGKFLKYGKRGKPHIRHVCCNVLGNLHWDDIAMDCTQFRPSENFIRLKEVTNVSKGKETEVFRRSNAKDAPDYLCFSISTPDRTLDLQAVSVEQRDLWVRALESVIRDVNSGMVNIMTGARLDDANRQVASTPEDSLVSAPGTTAEPSFTTDGDSTPRANRDGGSTPRANAAPAPTPAPAPIAPTAAVPAIATAAAPKEGGSSLFLPATGEKLLQQGEDLIKFGRAGLPKKKWVNVADDKLFWGSYQGPSSAVDASSILLSDVQAIPKGKTTDIFKRRAAADVPEECCFSLVLKSRSVDFQAESEVRRDEWVKALTEAVSKAKSAAHEKWLEKKRQEAANSRAVAQQQQQAEVAALNATRPTSAVPPPKLLSDFMHETKALPEGSDQQFDFETMDLNRVRSATTLAPSAKPPPPKAPVPQHIRAQQDAQTRAQSQSISGTPSFSFSFTGFRPGLPQDPAKVQAALDFLDMGEKLVKFGRLGAPKQKWVNVRKGKLYWGLFSQPSSSADSSYIHLAEVQSVQLGKVTDVFMRKNAATAPEDQCFSLILKNRTVDFQAETPDSAQVWVESLNLAITQSKNEAHQTWLAKKRSEALETRISLSGKAAADAVRVRSGTTSMSGTQTMRLPASMGGGSISGRSNTISLKRSKTISRPSVDDIQNYMEQESRPRSETEQDDSDDDRSIVEEEEPEKEPEAAVVDVDPSKAPVLPTVIATMARRGSVALMAANMQRNMERQQRMQNQMLLQQGTPAPAGGAPAGSVPK